MDVDATRILLDFRPANIHNLVMASIEEVVERLKSNRPKMLRYIAAVQLLLGLFLLFMAYYMGHTHLHLIFYGWQSAHQSLPKNKMILSKESHSVGFQESEIFFWGSLSDNACT